MPGKIGDAPTLVKPEDFFAGNKKADIMSAFLFDPPKWAGQAITVK